MEKLYEYYSNIESKEVEWLWYPYIPFGKITLLQGDPGDGKSTIAINISALLSNGLKMPFREEKLKPINVIYQCAEDGVADTIKPRLALAGANCERIIYIIEDDEELQLLDNKIEQVIKRTKSRLLVIDPIQAFLGSNNDMQSALKMRTTMRTIAKVAERNKCAVLLIGHMNKASKGKNLYRGLGSIDITAIARSVLMVVKDNDDKNKRYLFQIKNNLAPEGKPILFNINDGVINWISEEEVDIDEIENEYRKRISKIGLASEIILLMLEEGAVESNKIYDTCLEKGISKRTVQSAKEEMNISVFKKNNTWYWKLNENDKLEDA